MNYKTYYKQKQGMLLRFHDLDWQKVENPILAIEGRVRQPGERP